MENFPVFALALPCEGKPTCRVICKSWITPFHEAQAVSKVAGKIGANRRSYTAIIKAGGSVGGGWAGAKAGATVGTFIYPDPGTIIGALAGGLGGGIIGDKAAEEGGEFIIKKITDN